MSANYSELQCETKRDAKCAQHGRERVDGKLMKNWRRCERRPGEQMESRRLQFAKGASLPSKSRDKVSAPFSSPRSDFQVESASLSVGFSRRADNRWETRRSRSHQGPPTPRLPDIASKTVQAGKTRQCRWIAPDEESWERDGNGQ